MITRCSMGVDVVAVGIEELPAAVPAVIMYVKNPGSDA